MASGVGRLRCCQRLGGFLGFSVEFVCLSSVFRPTPSQQQTNALAFRRLG